jgi:hypothetical protein
LRWFPTRDPGQKPPKAVEIEVYRWHTLDVMGDGYGAVYERNALIEQIRGFVPYVSDYSTQLAPVVRRILLKKEPGGFYAGALTLPRLMAVGERNTKAGRPTKVWIGYTIGLEGKLVR